MPRLQQALRIRRGEEATVARLLVFMFVVWAGAAIGSSAAESLFFARFGPRYLPYMYIVVGLVTFPVMLAIGALLARLDRRRVFTTLLVGLALFVAALRGLLLIDGRWVYPPLWLGMMVMWTALGTVTWGLAGSVHDTRQAKRLFPLYAAGAILGGAVGGFLTSPLAQSLHAENLLLVWVASLIAAIIVATSIVGRSRRRRLPGPRPKRIGLLEPALQGARYVRRSHLASWMSIAIVLFNILYFSLTLPFAKAATDRFTDADSLSGFLGLFTGATNAVALLVSIGVANRLFARFGVPTAVLTFPFIYFVGFAVLVITPGFAPLATIRFVQWVWMYGVWATGWQALRGVVPTEWREQVRAFMDGGPLQAGVILAGIFLLATQEVLTARQFFLVAALLATAAVAASWRLRRAYVGELVSALRAGWPEVFITEEDPIGGPLRDRVARSTLIDGTRDPEPGVRRLALEMLAWLPQAGGEVVVRERLEDEDAGVRLAALHAVGRSQTPEALPTALRLLDDDDAHVRAAAADVVATCSDGGIEVADRLRGLLVDPDAGARVQAAEALVRIANDPEAIAVLEVTAKSPNFEDRAAALDALADVRLRPDLVADALRDEHPAVRTAAARALPNFGAEAATQPLLAALGDDDPGVREALTDALVNIDGKVASRLAEALEDGAMEEAALRALVRLPDADDSTLRSYASHQRERAGGYHQAWQQFANHTDRRVQPLVAGLRHAALRRAEYAVLALAPFGDHRALDLAMADLTSRDPNQRANAIETVDALADPAVVRPLLAIWEPQAASRPAGAEALRPLLRDEDPWIRACAVFSVNALDDGRLEQTVRDLADNDQDATVRASAGRALEGAQSVETLSTLSLMDRVLALGQVPLFRELAPADLKHVADAVVENVYVDGTVIAEQGDPGDAMHVVVSGEVRVLMGEQEPAEVARRGPGYIVGEMAILGEQPRMANLVAVGEVKTLSIDRKRFQRILRERPDAALAVMRELSVRLAEAHGASTT